MNAFLFDLNACTGCQACQIACAIENELPPGGSWREIYSFNEAHHPEAPVFHLSLACNHCAEAPCMEHCPALAYRRDPATGAVLLDPELCIGCKYCSWACPYDAPRYQPQAGVMTKCTFCNHRLAEGLEPACVALCPTGALGFGDLETAPGVDLVPGFPEAGCGPSIRFQPLREGHRMPEVLGADSRAPERKSPLDPPFSKGGTSGSRSHCRRPKWGRRRPSPFDKGGAGGGFSPEAGWEVGAELASARAGAPVLPPSKITLRSEWPLLIFTLLAAVLVGAQTTAALGRPVLPSWLLAALAILNMGFASLHLGKKLRAWRAVLNLRRSWLSREIFLYGLFVALAAGGAAAETLGIATGGSWAKAGALVGLAALFAMDRVYDVVRQPRVLGLHSAEVLPNGLLLAGVFLASLPWVGFLALGKLGLYVARKVRLRRQGLAWHPGWSALRLGLGFAAPLALSLADPQRWPLWALLGTAVGEIVDRCEFYRELEVPAPRRQVVLDLVAMVRSGA